jgi:hypothetical protein
MILKTFLFIRFSNVAVEIFSYGTITRIQEKKYFWVRENENKRKRNKERERAQTERHRESNVGKIERIQSITATDDIKIISSTKHFSSLTVINK